MSRPASRGSRTPPSERLITRAPFSTAQRIASASASSETCRFARTTFAISSCDGNAIPATPIELFVCAAISPATNVPWPCWSVRALPPTKLREPAIREARSGCVPSIPESITAMRGPARAGSSGQKSNA